MEIKLDKIGRRYNQEWIFRKIDFNFYQGNSYAILGPNGSGKSTLIQVLSASLGQSEGKLSYSNLGKEVNVEDVFNHIVIAAPYLELIEEFTLSELIDFHFSFKNYLPQFNKKEVIELVGLKSSIHKPVKYFSSGMKQRTKLVLALCSDAAIVFLDEPTANLDKQGVNWYLSLIRELTTNKLVIVGSNQEDEYQFCTNQLLITDYK